MPEQPGTSPETQRAVEFLEEMEHTSEFITLAQETQERFEEDGVDEEIEPAEDVPDAGCAFGRRVNDLERLGDPM